MSSIETPQIQTSDAASGLTKHELAGLCCRMLGLWFMASFALRLPGVIWTVFAAATGTPQASDMWAYYGFNAVYTLLGFGVGLVLWIRGPWLGRMMLRADGRVFSHARFHLRQLQRIAVGTLGLYFIATGMIGVVVSVSAMGVSWLDVMRESRDYTTGWGETLARLIVGLALVLGRRGIVRMLRRLQQVGLSSKGTA